MRLVNDMSCVRFMRINFTRACKRLKCDLLLLPTVPTGVTNAGM